MRWSFGSILPRLRPVASPRRRIGRSRADARSTMDRLLKSLPSAGFSPCLVGVRNPLRSQTTTTLVASPLLLSTTTKQSENGGQRSVFDLLPHRRCAYSEQYVLDDQGTLMRNISRSFIFPALLLRCPFDYQNPLGPLMQRIPEWLNDEPFDFDDAHVPPSYLIASLQEAFNEPLYDQAPPTYDHTIATSNGTSRRRISIAEESMWDDEDEDGSNDDETIEEGARDHDEDDDEEMPYGSVGDVENPRYAGLWTNSVIDRISDDGVSTSTPTASSSSRSSAPSSLPYKHDSVHSRLEYSAPPPAYHLLHLQCLSWPGLRESLGSYHALNSSLASLDSQLLLTPFSAFADVCYEASVLGDTSPAPTRPFSSSPRKIRALPQIPVRLAPSKARVSEDDEDSDEDEDDEVPKSPTQTFNVIASPPLIWDPKVEEHSRSRSELPISMSRSISTPYFLPPPQDGLSSPASESGRSAPEKSVCFLVLCSQIAIPLVEAILTLCVSETSRDDG
ncbi:hypothetical protein BDY19DRAFT_301490 [Irpex rosettiformis]|uniref:Uncharacterized protein n=1 Tax=Irpex rosettiformis TaxID=378272 RepID=A0ACB8TYP4_9APHY|nr:hypothetical protein BDY19DRAFT_301490 [Irpex rosettiformis]